jgi:dephospho-CoA kinase
MKVIGLAGGSGTGKSTIAAHLVARGAGHIDADRVAHDVLLKDEGVVRAIRERFGDGVFTGGLVDRGKLGGIVFGDRKALETLNAIVHPAVLEVCRRKLEEFETAGVALAVVDAALLLEVVFPFEIDLVIALRASRDEQVRRLLAKGGATRSDIEARLDSQRHLERSCEAADVVVDTAKPLALVLAEVDRVVDALIAEDSSEREDG